MTDIAGQIIQFYTQLQPPPGLPGDIEVLYPQQHENVMKLVRTFFSKFYNDQNSRRLIFGINPGRFGAGTTGINFTAPKQLSNYCSIDHDFKPQTELSAEFIYEVIERYGGVVEFYSDYFITAVCPLGFVRNGKNMNYYDNKELFFALKSFIVENLRKQLAFAKIDRCICIGEEKNFNHLLALNKEYGFFKEIIPLPHPRFIMQYRRKQKEKFVEQYLSVLRREL
jgi:uracil-DNA glycosylase